MHLEPRSHDMAKDFARIAMMSKLQYGSFGSEQAVYMIVLTGRELGFPAVASLRAFDVIQGKPTPKAETLRALVLNSGKAEYFTCTDRSATSATFKTLRKGTPEAVTLTYTIEEAQMAWDKGRTPEEREKTWKDSGYAKNPADMLVARASSKLARMEYPDVTLGLIAKEEFNNDGRD
jgi:hypothetical protein